MAFLCSGKIDWVLTFSFFHHLCLGRIYVFHLQRPSSSHWQPLDPIFKYTTSEPISTLHLQIIQYIFWEALVEMDTATRVQILDEAVCISHNNYTLERYASKYSPSSFAWTFKTWLINFVTVNSLRELLLHKKTLWIQTFITPLENDVVSNRLRRSWVNTICLYLILDDIESDFSFNKNALQVISK